jgi:anti-anti-sigma factor
LALSGKLDVTTAEVFENKILDKSRADDMRSLETQIMEITERKTADVVTLGLSGKMDAATAKTFEEKLLSQIQSGERRFVINLAQLDYISSAGLRVFLLAAKRLNSADGKIVLCSLQAPVSEVFEISGFSSIFSIYGSHDDAIKNL